MLTYGLLSDIDCPLLAKKILKEEPKIIKKFPPLQGDGSNGDSGTGLGPNSLTSRFYWYNVLKWKEAERLKHWISKGYEGWSGGDPTDLHVKCWANVMRKGDQVLPHRHSPYSLNPRELMSGNLTIQSDGTTSTSYEAFGKRRAIKNKNGEIQLFNAGTTHWTNVYMGDDVRITVAFDIMSDDYYRQNAEEDVKDKIVTLNSSYW